MIDLHNHLLYGMDDGPETLEESLEMCRIAWGDGIRTVVATPHMLNGVYRNSRKAILSGVKELNAALVQSGWGNSGCGVESLNSELRTPNSELNSASVLRACPAVLATFDSDLRPPTSELDSLPPSPLKILPGADVHLGGEILAYLKEEKLMTLGDGKKYILIEFPSQGIPYLAEKILFQFVAQGIVPIITHPERNLEVGRRPVRYFEMIRTGCLGQATAMSLTGGFGPEVRQLAEKLLLHRLVHVIASDAHSIEGRPPILTPGVKAVSKLVGEEEALRMVTEYPLAILDGRHPAVRPPIPF
jgi:protein-tyrosine phosphatase